MKVLFSKQDARLLGTALQVAIGHWQLTSDQEKIAKLLSKKGAEIEASQAPSPSLDFDIFEAVRAYDFIEFMLEDICQDNEHYSQIFLFSQIILLAKLQTTLKYGISPRSQ